MRPERDERGLVGTIPQPNHEQRAYSIRWDAGGDLAVSFEALNRATDWTSFTAAIESFALPSSRR